MLAIGKPFSMNPVKIKFVIVFTDHQNFNLKHNLINSKTISKKNLPRSKSQLNNESELKKLKNKLESRDLKRNVHWKSPSTK